MENINRLYVIRKLRMNQIKKMKIKFLRYLKIYNNK